MRSSWGPWVCWAQSRGAEGRPDGGCSSSQGAEGSAELCSVTATGPEGTAWSCVRGRAAGLRERICTRGLCVWKGLPRAVGMAPNTRFQWVSGQPLKHRVWIFSGAVWGQGWTQRFLWVPSNFRYSILWILLERNRNGPQQHKNGYKKTTRNLINQPK